VELKQAQALAAEVVGILTPVVERVEVVGSIRRQRPTVRDIDLVLIPKNQGLLDTKLREMGCQFGGPKIRRLVYPRDMGAPVDIYIATPETWATLLLIRTGSTRHNVYLCKLARARGWQLKANGQGLLDSQDKRVAGDTEQSIFAALGLKYREPEERE
jgi:DNA polymerase (family 10)